MAENHKGTDGMCGVIPSGSSVTPSKAPCPALLSAPLLWPLDSVGNREEREVLGAGRGRVPLHASVGAGRGLQTCCLHFSPAARTARHQPPSHPWPLSHWAVDEASDVVCCLTLVLLGLAQGHYDGLYSEAKLRS